jgi:outer membrane protein TolC
MPGKIRLAAALLVCAGVTSAYAQLTIDACRAKAREHYPLSRQYALIDRTRELDLEMARRGYLPRVSLSGKASYQSDVTSLGSLASALPPSLSSALASASVSQDQYQALAELSQSIWDGGSVSAQIEGIEDSSRVEERRLDVDLYALNDRVDQLFFGILAVREQLEENAVLAGELDSSYRRAEAGVSNGVADRSDLDAVRVEALDAEQKRIELSATEKSYREMLSAMIGEEVTEDTAIAMPDLSAPPGGGNRRRELGLFDAQGKAWDSQEAAVRAADAPRLSAFFQAAYGEPGLNMFKGGFTPYWLGGLRLTWSLNALADMKDQFERIGAARATIEAQRDAFLLDDGMQAARLRNDIERLRGLLSRDDEIIALREAMRESTEGKMDNGAATTDDVLRAIDAESLARRGKSLHEVQLATAIYALKNALNE